MADSPKFYLKWECASCGYIILAEECPPSCPNCGSTLLHLLGED